MPKVVITLDVPVTLQAAIIQQIRETLKSRTRNGCLAIDETDYAVQGEGYDSEDNLIVYASAGFGNSKFLADKILNLTAKA